MGKLTEALNKVDKDREEQKNRARLSAEEYSKGGRNMKNSWWVWLFIVGFVVTIFVSFNAQKGKETTPLTEIFPDEEVAGVDVEYEFVDEKTAQNSEESTQKIKQSKEVQKEVVQEVVRKEVPIASEKKIEVKKIVKKPLAGTKVYTIQVASFKTEDRAKKSLQGLKEKGFSSAYIMSKNLGAKGVWYRIYVGKFNTKAKAKETLVKVKKIYKGSFIIKRK